MDKLKIKIKHLENCDYILIENYDSYEYLKKNNLIFKKN